MTHEITKDEAKKFLETQKYDFLMSTKVKISDMGFDEPEEDFYIPISKEDFIKEYLEEELCVWQGPDQEFSGIWDNDWEQILGDILSAPSEHEESFRKYCEQNDINSSDYEVEKE